jgi:hypothetical protein
MDVSMAESCSGVAEMGEVGVGMSLQANTRTGRSGHAQTRIQCRLLAPQVLLQRALSPTDEVPCPSPLCVLNNLLQWFLALTGPASKGRVVIVRVLE